MVVTEQKTKEKILADIKPYHRVLIAGCGDCATTCRTGGKKELDSMKNLLEEAGHEVTGLFLPEVGCLLPAVRKEARSFSEALDKSDAVLVLSCGLGSQVLTEVTGKWVVPGCDTVNIGANWKTAFSPAGLENIIEEKCSLCGDCVLSLTGGLCPHTLCAKGLLGGPCGGTKPDGKCETGNEETCGWLLIYERLKELGRLDLMKETIAPRDWSRRRKPARRKALV